MYIDKFQIRRVRPLKKNQPVQFQQNKVKPQSNTLMEDPKFRAIKIAKVEQYQKVIRTAIEVLKEFNDEARYAIRWEFKIYEDLAEKEERYLKRYKQDSLLQMLFIYKTIADVYWALPDDIKQKWNEVPELKAWKEKYR